jgi:hypothetical protein
MGMHPLAPPPLRSIFFNHLEFHTRAINEYGSKMCISMAAKVNK